MKAYKIQTPTDWWTLLDAHWADLLVCFQLVGAPMSLDERGYWWSEMAGEPVKRHDRSLLRALEEAKISKDHEFLLRMLQAVWNAAPDSRKIHGWPSWHVLCDLCSEEWVFEPEELNAD